MKTVAGDFIKMNKRFDGYAIELATSLLPVLVIMRLKTFSH